jgi:hypothetical protein
LPSGKAKEADEVYDGVLQEQEQLLGSNHPNLGFFLLFYAAVKADSERFEVFLHGIRCIFIHPGI